jgi:hypothetical protein
VLAVLLLAGLWAAYSTIPARPLCAWRRPADRYIGQFRLSPNGACFLAYDRGNKPGSGPVFDRWQLFETATGRVLTTAKSMREVTQHEKFAPDGSWLATTDQVSGVITLYDTVTGHVLRELPPVDARFGVGRHFVISQDGLLLACTAHNHWPPAVQIWDTTTGRLVATLDRAAPPFAFSPDGRTLATVSPEDHDRSSNVKLWDTTDGHLVGALSHEKFAQPAALAFSPDGRRLAAGRPTNFKPEPAEKTVTVWNLPAGTVAAILPVDDDEFWIHLRHEVTGLALSPNGRYLTSLWARSGRFWDLAASPPRCLDDLLDRAAGGVAGVQLTERPVPTFAASGSRFVVPVAGRHEFVVFDADRLTPVMTVASLAPAQAIGRGISWPELSPDGRLIVVVDPAAVVPVSRIEQWLSGWLGRPVRLFSSRGNFHVHDVATGTELGRIPADGSILGFSHDGHDLWTYAQDSGGGTGQQTLEVKRWSVPTGYPPAWPIGVSVLLLLLVIADWHRSRRRRGLPAAAAVGYPAEQGGPTP